MRRFIQLVVFAMLSVLVAPVVVTAVLAAEPGKPPAEQPSETLSQKIDRLIRELGDEKYSVRENAQKELAEIGYEAYDALTAASTDDDLERATRARYLLLLIPAQWSIANEPPEVRRYLTYYQSQSSDVRLAVLRELTEMPGGVGLPSLCRLVRFEKSTEWSKQVAVALLDGEPVDAAGRERWAKAVREHLGQSARPGAQWLRAYVRLREDPKAAIAEWARLVEEEHKVVLRSPDQSSPRIAAALLYHLAMAQAEQGDEATAEKTAQEARELAPVQSTARMGARYDAAIALQRRGRLRWADLEYRRVIDSGLSYPKVRAALRLSEMWHDQGEHLVAAAALEKLLEMEPDDLGRMLDPLGRTVEEVRARSSYFHACHCESQGDRAKQREFLDEALKHDPSELDALIARYHLPDADPEYRQQTVKLIEKAASTLRLAMAEGSNTAIFSNQLAWLVGNTEGDRDEALRCAKRAVELEPETGAYLDTLAHVHFGRGELEEAVKWQAKAAEYEPYSGMIVKKLEVFRRALEEKQAKASQPPNNEKPEPGGETPGPAQPPAPPAEKTP